jgi:hypothetical protein
MLTDRDVSLDMILNADLVSLLKAEFDLGAAVRKLFIGLHRFADRAQKGKPHQ